MLQTRPPSSSSRTKSGFDVIVATNGEDALALAKHEAVCAVVSDVAMPGTVNGLGHFRFWPTSDVELAAGDVRC
jgi:DNA-binding response OmpR family regulator